MDDLDARILKVLQNDFPLSERPYDIMAEKLAIERNLLWKRIKRLTADGVIRRIGVSLDSRRLGYFGTLCAVSVPAKLVECASECINALPQITHCYFRDHAFNIWFTVIAPDAAQIHSVLDRIRDNLALDTSRILNLPMKRVFKLDARFSRL